MDLFAKYQEAVADAADAVKRASRDLQTLTVVRCDRCDATPIREVTLMNAYRARLCDHCLDEWDRACLDPSTKPGAAYQNKSIAEALLEHSGVTTIDEQRIEERVVNLIAAQKAAYLAAEAWIKAGVIHVRDDLKALKDACTALERSSANHYMLEANLKFLIDRYLDHPADDLPSHLKK